MKKTKAETMHLGGSQGTYCGWDYNDERRQIRHVTHMDTRIESDRALPILPPWLRWCGSCLRVRSAL